MLEIIIFLVIIWLILREPLVGTRNILQVQPDRNYIKSEDPMYYPPVQESFTEVDGAFALPSIKDPRTKSTYLEDIKGMIYTEGDQSRHGAYVEKRINTGDHTAQLWGIDSGKKGYSYNFVGPRPPRKYMEDPLSAIQGSTGNQDFADPKMARLI